MVHIKKKSLKQKLPQCLIYSILFIIKEMQMKTSQYVLLRGW